MSIDPIFWLLAAVGFLALEGMTFSMVSVWFAAGSAAALLCCLFTHSFRVQAVVFIAVSAVCLLAFKPPFLPSRRAGCGWMAWTGAPAAPPPAIP